MAMLTILPMLLGLQATALSNDELIGKISDSGRSTVAGETPDERVADKPMIAPGQPPLLSFRYYEGKMHYRYGNADLMLDDAGH